MNEKAPREAEIIPFSDKIQQLDALSDRDVIRHFLSELRHPGVRPHLVEYIMDTTNSEPGKGMSAERVAWRQRLAGIVEGKEDDEPEDPWSAALSETTIENRDDEIVVRIEAILKGTLDRAKDLREERKALLKLIDLREAALRRGMQGEDVETWENVITKIESRVR